MSQLLLPIEDRSHVGNARRAAAELATRLGFDETLNGKVGLAVTELATNIVKHAGAGRLLLRELSEGSAAGLEVLALDKGPGIADVSASLRDGHSTTGTMGSGLGAIARLSPEFEIYTQPGKGLALRMALWMHAPGTQPASIEYGGICLAKAGEAVSGDAWSVARDRGFLSVLLADGLGHGLQAHEAARAAVQTLQAHPEAEPEALVLACHAALARTRGAALGVARLAPNAARGAFAGVGNIVARVVGSTSRHLASYNGTVGHTLHRVREFAFPWPTGSLLILHSDGLGTHWDLAAYPGLTARHPALIAGVLYRDYDRGRDDVTVVVLRNRGSEGGS